MNLGSSGMGAAGGLHPTAVAACGGMPPHGYTWTTRNGARVYFNGRPVFDDGENFYYRGPQL